MSYVEVISITNSGDEALFVEFSEEVAIAIDGDNPAWFTDIGNLTTGGFQQSATVIKFNLTSIVTLDTRLAWAPDVVLSAPSGALLRGGIFPITPV